VLIAQLELLLPQFGLAMAVVAVGAVVILGAGEETVEPIFGITAGVIDVAVGVVSDAVAVVVVLAAVVPPVVVVEVLVEAEGLGDDEAVLAGVVLDPEAGPPAMAMATLPEPEDIPPSVLDNC